VCSWRWQRAAGSGSRGCCGGRRPACRGFLPIPEASRSLRAPAGARKGSRTPCEPGVERKEFPIPSWRISCRHRRSTTDTPTRRTGCPHDAPPPPGRPASAQAGRRQAGRVRCASVFGGAGHRRAYVGALRPHYSTSNATAGLERCPLSEASTRGALWGENRGCSGSGHQFDRRWCLGTLARRGDLRGAALRRALDLVDSPFARKRLAAIAG